MALFAFDFRLAASCLASLSLSLSPSFVSLHLLFPHHVAGICHWSINSIDLCSQRQFESHLPSRIPPRPLPRLPVAQIEFQHSYLFELRLEIFFISFSPRCCPVHGWTSRRVQEFIVLTHAFSIFMARFLELQVKFPQIE